MIVALVDIQMLQAIETRYAGRRFRSRREARWAILFDELDIDWRYEPEGYVLPGNVHYLIDFELHLGNGRIQYVEVKHELEENAKLASLVEESGKTGFLVAEPALRSMVLVCCPANGWLKRKPTDWLTSISGRDSMSVQAASNAALSARWEHGEQPRRRRKVGGRPRRMYQSTEALMREHSAVGSSAFGSSF